jgi:predicted RNA-binding Zn-ribbon protein involved in translation (DUF1610 family)
MKNSQDYSAIGRKIVSKDSFVFLSDIGYLTPEMRMLCHRGVEVGAAIPLDYYCPACGNRFIASAKTCVAIDGGSG